MFENIALEISNGICILTINRPKQLNALNKQTIEETHKALKDLEADHQVGVVILTGAEDKAFVAGADIKEFADFSIAQGGSLAQEGQKLKVKMFNSFWDAEVTCDSPYDPKNETIRKDG